MSSGGGLKLAKGPLANTSGKEGLIILQRHELAPHHVVNRIDVGTRAQARQLAQTLLDWAEADEIVEEALKMDNICNDGA